MLQNGLYVRIRQGVDGLATIPVWMKKIPKIGSLVSVRVQDIDEKKRYIFCIILRVIRNNKLEDTLWKRKKHYYFQT